MSLESTPQDVDAERHVLGSLILDSEAVHRVVPILGDQITVFYRPEHQVIYNAALRLASRRDPVDLYSITRELKRSHDLEKAGGVAYLYELQESVPTSAHAEYYAQIVKEMAIRRELIQAGAEIVSRARQDELSLEEVVDHAQALVLRVNRSEQQRGLQPLHVIINETVEHLARIFERKEPLLGVPTGLPELDRILAGMNRTDLIILAARPSMGKSAFAHNIAMNVAFRQGLPVALFSLEMGREQIVQRLLASECRLPLGKIRRGNLTPQEWQRVSERADELSRVPLYINDTAGITMWEIRSESRRLKLHHPELALIIVDYLQLIQGAARNVNSREQEISAYSRSLKELARELNVPVLALSQLNRAVESRQDKRPQLADLRESGAIEQDADVVMFLYREEYYHPETDAQGQVEVLIRKHRNGELGTVTLRFHHQYLLFTPLEQFGVNQQVHA